VFSKAPLLIAERAEHAHVPGATAATASVEAVPNVRPSRASVNVGDVRPLPVAVTALQRAGHAPMLLGLCVRSVSLRGRARVVVRGAARRPVVSSGITQVEDRLIRLGALLHGGCEIKVVQVVRRTKAAGHRVKTRVHRVL